MGRRGKSSGDSVLGVMALIAIAAAINYWQYVLGIGAVCAFFWVVSKASTKKPAKPQVTARDIEKLGLTISIGVPSDRKLTKSSIPFYLAPQKVTVGSFNIPAHLIYVGKDKEQLPHVINPSLTLGTARPTYSAQMGYWPSYHSILSDDRATYLAWLAGGRTYATPDIGFVFLYFYGLEFRALVDKENLSEVLEELICLYLRYAALSGSFSKYCGSLINLLMVENALQPSNAETLAEYLFKNPKEMPLFKDSIQLLSRKVSSGDALAMYFFAQERISVSSKYRDELANIVATFREQLKNSPVVEFASRTANIYYRTASSIGLNANAKVTTQELSKKSFEHAQVRWNDCIGQFAGYSKMKKSNSELADFLAPAGSNQKATALKEKFKRILDFSEFKTFSVNDLTAAAGASSNESLSVGEAKAFAGALERMGIAIEPDPRLTGKGLKSDEKVVLVKRDLSNIDSDRWKKAMPLFDLAMAVAVGDDHENDAEVLHTLKFIDKQFKLGKGESDRLSYRAKLLKETKIAIPVLVKRVASSLTINQGETIAKFLFSIAALDGKLEQGEIAVLEKTFKAFNFQPDTLERLISEFSANTGGNLVVLKKSTGKSAKTGSKIPQQKVAGSRTVALDTVALEKAFKEADEVSNLLSAVFVEEEADSKSSEAVAQSNVTFSSAEHQVLAKLIEKDSWLVSEVETLCRASGVMYGALLTKVNDYFENISGDVALEEDGDELTISREYILTGVRSA